MNIKTKLSKLFEILSRINEPSVFLETLETLKTYTNMKIEKKNNILLPTSIEIQDLFNCKYDPELEKIKKEISCKKDINYHEKCDEIRNKASDMLEILKSFDFDESENIEGEFDND
ncbi:hypothetical protein DMUE_1152 [Dictyocoela muelleri]|nr:hypothetical protein DMUE_1152 [Dictyocoela muelleri]